MKSLLIITAAAAVQLQSPEAVIECAKAVQDHNAAIEQVSAALKTYTGCLDARRVDACTAEFRQLSQAQDRYEQVARRLRDHCPSDELRRMEAG